MFKLRTFSIWILILVFGTGVVTTVAVAQNARRVQGADPAALPFADPMVPESHPNPIQIDKVGSWSMLTYQKLKNQNWDIYVHGLSGPQRLTSAKAADQHPTLDRGTRRVAFVSDRSGDFDLYLIRTNGTALQRILDTRSTIAFPAWSPDGKKIAIQSEVGAQYEIHVVNDNGGNPQRLTNHPAFDGMPAWSPDGKQLAFASNRSGDFRIYVMNADGSGVRKLSSYPFSLHPTWSPDGRSIAFDADIDGDGWQELAIIDASGSNERMVYNPGLNQTAWAGSWAPDKSALGFNEITAEKQNGQWVWTKAVVRQWTPKNGAVDLIPGGKEWYMKWETSDDLPPITTIDRLPKYSKAENFWLRWSGVDTGGSGLKFYSVYYDSKDGTGWHTYWRNTSVTQAPFPAEPGATVEFLVSGTDNAYNSGPWKQQITQQTTFYNSKIAGTINDNRGNPLSGVTVKSSPDLPTSPVVSGWQGVFSGYTFEDNDYTIAVDEPHFAAVPNTTVAAGDDYLRDIYLMPDDSRIKNGAFERSSSQPLEWTTGGTLPQAVSSEDAATGRYSVRLGPAAAGAIQTGQQNTGTASISQVVTIPANMQGPTLTYMARKVGDPPPGNSGLRVLINPATEKVPVSFNAASAEDWNLNWINMQPWQGRQVTVTFELVQDAGDPPQTIYLDDISLGSIHPDLWVFLTSGPAEAIPGEIVSVTLDYGNRGPLLAKDSVVELALPPELSLVSATPPYTVRNNVVRWEIGDLQPKGASNRLRIEVSPASHTGEVVVLRSLVYTGTTEAHLRNNTSEAKVRIVKNLYLPLVARE